MKSMHIMKVQKRENVTYTVSPINVNTQMIQIKKDKES